MQNAECKIKVTFFALLKKYIFEQSEKIYL